MPTPATMPFEMQVGGGAECLRGDRLPGEPPAYVFVHGLGSVRRGDKSDSLLAHAAARGRAFIRFDQRGHGESTGRIGHVTIGELIADLVQLLHSLGPCAVVGSSLGGLVGAFAAAARPDLVRGLCLLAPAFGFLDNLDRLVDAEGLMRTSEGVAFAVERRVLDDARRLDERDLPRRLHVPTLVVHGTGDDVVPFRHSERFFAAIEHPRKDLWIVPGGDHRLNAHAAAVWPRFDRLVGA